MEAALSGPLRAPAGPGAHSPVVDVSFARCMRCEGAVCLLEGTRTPLPQPVTANSEAGDFPGRCLLSVGFEGLRHHMEPHPVTRQGPPQVSPSLRELGQGCQKRWGPCPE